jgi:hypothetical protein
MKDRIRNILLESIAFKDRSNINDNFWAWFKDSKVVDSSGNPLITYHGTKNDFGSFDKRMKQLNFVSSELGFYFTSGAIPDTSNGIYYGSTASEYADMAKGTTFSGPNVMPVYLSIQNPLILNSDHSYSPNTLIDTAREEISKEIYDNGYDGIIVRNKEQLSNLEIICVVIEPEQIKSIFNQGTWSPNNPDIMK